VCGHVLVYWKGDILAIKLITPETFVPADPQTETLLHKAVSTDMLLHKAVGIS